MNNKLIDFTNCENGYRKYEGSDGKKSIIYNGDYYLLKLPSKKETINELQTSHVNNVISEYISSKIIKEIGIPVHDVILGVYEGEMVVACKDFTNEDYKLQEFSWFMKNIYRRDDIGRTVRYDQLYDVVKTNNVLNKIEKDAISSYWDMFVCDALIGNFDRHKDNWGYLVNEKTKDIKLAPIYDNGSSLYPELSEEGMIKILSNQKEIDERIFVFPKAALNKNTNNKKIEKFTYKELLEDGIDKNYEEAVKRIFPKINMKNIEKIINEIDILSDTRKTFYKTMLNERYEKLLAHAFEKIKTNEQNNEIKKWEDEIFKKAGLENSKDSYEKVLLNTDREK